MTAISKAGKIYEQRTAFAIKACHMMGKSVEETAACLVMPATQVQSMYNFIEKDWVDFESPFSE